MKEKRYNRLQKLAVALALLLTSLLPSCSDDDSNSPDLPENKLYTLTIQLQPSSSYTPVTKAEDNPSFEEEEKTYERRINECWVAVFDTEGNWKATVSTNDFNINNSHEDSESSATVKLPIGTYTFYAFANLNSLSDTDKGIIQELESGKQSGTNALTQSYLESKTVSLQDRGKYILPTGETAPETGLPIPMSSYATTATVAENSNNKVNLTLFRMLGKVTITIDNQTGEQKELKHLSIGAFRTGPICLLPYSQGDLTLNDLPGTTAAEQLQPQFPADVTANTETVIIEENGTSTIEADKQYQGTFYAFETGTETNQANAGDISLSIQIGNRPLSTKMTDFSFMRRNDWLKIPIILSDIESTIKFLNNRMPIGGLPPEVVFGKDDGVQILVDAVNTIDPTYAGPIDIEVTLKSINNVSAPSILYTSSTAEGTDRSTAVLEDNTNGLLINKATGSPLTTNDTKKETFNVEKSPSDNNALNKCYFRVWAQELGRNSSATIKLTILAEYGTETPKRRIEIPYTIVIQNFKKTTN